ncbi:MAG: hypothetical protein LUM44_17785 [Pyrinomonadaceae bacterium]|nr:hypothetical protein [Pyrinomonadaceae bacterium]
MHFKFAAELPENGNCNICGNTKPLCEIVVVFRRKEKRYYVRPRCKECHNAKERGNRREYKSNYLKNWRKNNASANKSYWQNDETRERARVNALKRFNEKHEAILIQGRFARRGMNITINEAEEYLLGFGRCYPTRFGLTKDGLKECERIRATKRRRGLKRFSAFDIRLAVYEDALENKSFLIPPEKQPVPYLKASQRLAEYQRSKKGNYAEK